MNIDKEIIIQDEKENLKKTKKENCPKYDIVDESDHEEFIKNLFLDKNIKKQIDCFYKK